MALKTSRNRRNVNKDAKDPHNASKRFDLVAFSRYSTIIFRVVLAELALI